MLRRSATWIALGLGACVLAPACVTPKDDYDSYLSRTASERAAAGETEGGVVDATPPDAGFMGTYVMSCISQVTAENPMDEVNFAANVTYVPSPGGAGGTLTFSDAALQVGATSITQTVETFNTKTTQVGADGQASIDYGPATVPGSADPVGSDIVFSDSKLQFLVSTGDGGIQICAAQVGHMTSPFDVALSAGSNPCVFLRADTTFPAFPLAQADYHCF